MYNVKRFKFGLHPPLSIYSVQIVQPHKNSWEVLVIEATLKAGFLTAVALVRVLVVYIELDQSSISVIAHCCSTVVRLL